MVKRRTVCLGLLVPLAAGGLSPAQAAFWDDDNTYDVIVVGAGGALR